VSKNAPELTARQLWCIFDTCQLGPSTRVVETIGLLLLLLLL